MVFLGYVGMYEGVTHRDLLSDVARGRHVVVDGVLNAIGLVVVAQPHLDPLVLDTHPELL